MQTVRERARLGARAGLRSGLLTDPGELTQAQYSRQGQACHSTRKVSSQAGARPAHLVVVKHLRAGRNRARRDYRDVLEPVHGDDFGVSIGVAAVVNVPRVSSRRAEQAGGVARLQQARCIGRRRQAIPRPSAAPSARRTLRRGTSNP